MPASDSVLRTVDVSFGRRCRRAYLDWCGFVHSSDPPGDDPVAPDIALQPDVLVEVEELPPSAPHRREGQVQSALPPEVGLVESDVEPGSLLRIRLDGRPDPQNAVVSEDDVVL